MAAALTKTRSFRGCQTTCSMKEKSLGCCFHEDVQTDDGGGDGRPGVDGNVGAIVAYSHSSETFDPTDGALDDPTYSSQVTALLLVAFPNVRLDAQPTENAPRRFAVVAGVCI